MMEAGLPFGPSSPFFPLLMRANDLRTGVARPFRGRVVCVLGAAPKRTRKPLCCGMLYPYGCTSPAYPRNLSGPAPFADCKTITTTHAKAPNLRRFMPPCRVIALRPFGANLRPLRCNSAFYHQLAERPLD